MIEGTNVTVDSADGGCECHCEDEDDGCVCGACCVCRCICGYGANGGLRWFNGGGKECWLVCPEDCSVCSTGHVHDEFGSCCICHCGITIKIPERITDDLNRLRDKAVEKLGLDDVMEGIESGIEEGMGNDLCLTVVIPMDKFSDAGFWPAGKKADMQEIKAAFCLGELAKDEWVHSFRMAVLFMLIFMFISGIFVVLRQY